MSLKLTVGDGAGHPVSEMILGHNIEMCLTTADGLLSERLRNPKFLGPPHPVTGNALDLPPLSILRVRFVIG